MRSESIDFFLSKDLRPQTAWLNTNVDRAPGLHGLLSWKRTDGCFGHSYESLACSDVRLCLPKCRNSDSPIFIIHFRAKGD